MAKSLSDQIKIAQGRLYHKLTGLDLKTLGISEYQQRYLSSKLADLKGWLQLYGRLLYLALRQNPVPPEEAVLVDYGGGSGLISFLAVEMGVGTVVYNDIYDVCCRDVVALSAALGLPITHIVCGDVDELVSYLGSKIPVNAIVSYDVLEHIYDVKHHFEVLGNVQGNFRVLYGSSANPKNPLIVRRLRRKQVEAEYVTRERMWGHYRLHSRFWLEQTVGKVSCLANLCSQFGGEVSVLWHNSSLIESGRTSFIWNFWSQSNDKTVKR